jgi:hypothetical protein
MPEASIWVDELQGIAARSGMREFTARAHMHRAALGETSSAEAARLLSNEIDNPVLNTWIDVSTHAYFQ